LSWDNFDKLISLYKFEIKLINLTPLSIGAGKSATSALEGLDNPVVRLNGKVYIPGSSLKGALRSEAEKYVRSVYGENFKYVCDILNPKGNNGELFQKDKLKENYKPCLVCRIFGGPTIASHIKVFDAFPQKSLTEIRKCVSIDRITGGQHPGRLFDVEYVVPNSEFSLKMEVENIDIMDNSDESKVIRYLLKKMINEGIQLGAKKSIGLGVLKVESFDVSKYYLKDGELQKEDMKERLNEFLRGEVK
jgi:CRISPR-associated RAMP protein (TIGR02581 family)